MMNIWEYMKKQIEFPYAFAYEASYQQCIPMGIYHPNISQHIPNIFNVFLGIYGIYWDDIGI